MKRGNVRLFALFLGSFFLSVPLQSAEKPLSFSRAEERWTECRDAYIGRLESVLSNIEKRIAEQRQRLDHGKREVRSAINEKLRDLHRARDEVKRRLSMMQLVTVSQWSNIPKDIVKFFEDVTDQ